MQTMLRVLCSFEHLDLLVVEIVAPTLAAHGALGFGRQFHCFGSRGSCVEGLVSRMVMAGMVMGPISSVQPSCSLSSSLASARSDSPAVVIFWTSSSTSPRTIVPAVSSSWSSACCSAGIVWLSKRSRVGFTNWSRSFPSSITSIALLLFGWLVPQFSAGLPELQGLIRLGRGVAERPLHPLPEEHPVLGSRLLYRVHDLVFDRNIEVFHTNPRK